MSDIQDFTKIQARGWVKCEAAKETTKEQILSRIDVEKRFCKLMKERGFASAYPNSYQGHLDLIALLECQLHVHEK